MVSALSHKNRVLRFANTRDTDSIIWYQSPWLGRSLGSSIADSKSETMNMNSGNAEVKSNSDRFQKDLWNQRRKEVLRRLEQLRISKQKGIRKPILDFEDKRKMKKSRCYICFTRGHAYWNCPNKHRKVEFKKKRNVFNDIIVPTPNWVVVGSDERGWDEIWYVSDEYPRHMTPNLEAFENFKACSIGSSNTGQQGLKVQGFGEVIVTTEARSYVIPGVYFVPKCGLNVLSLSQLIIQGFKVVLKDSKAVLTRQFEGECDDDSSDENSEGMGLKCSNKDLQELDLIKEKAINGVVKYFDSFYDGLSIEERLDGKEVFTSMIEFLKMVNEEEIKEGCKNLVKEHFEKLVKWFYKDYLDCVERPIPVKINDVEICLLDVYLTVNGMGGHTYVTTKNRWKEVAFALGFPRKFADGIKEVYGTHLGLLGAYYDVATRYSRDELAPEAEKCMGASEVMALGLPRKEDIPDCCVEDKAMDEDLADEEPVKKEGYYRNEDDVDFIMVD